MGETVTLNFDESGNLGTKGRYFTIACVETLNQKPLHNVIKKAVLKTKTEFNAFAEYKEIKASQAYPCIKDYFLRKIVSKDIKIKYVVADKDYVKKSLLQDENLLYNFMLQFIIVPVAKKPNVKRIVINLDKRTIKVQSGNSFEEYIKIKLMYELNLDVEVIVNYLESHNCYSIQAADFVANAVYSFYEYKHDYFFNILKPKIEHAEEFPYKNFGKEKMVI
ncbi:DUF3800 domain-containing protein [Bacillus swezeyi]|uniref:DUF3800 domain-containing protein n=1 Tax=Bacillus swezeyi TaxID=1925020 RepID=A0A5M8RTA9_9BACI|nr:DUF3800 domain-containing protein [Bacillus swezeyi]KAA6450326.1 DUF3800 domain-containing protein [Bacillus swezeyi]TYS36867.1 DUF3800 domain-containing protein [Bacillus swezeyi]